MILGLAASVYVHTAGEGIIDLEEAETSVQGGAFEGRAVSGEGDARSEPGMTDSLRLINAGKAQDPTDS